MQCQAPFQKLLNTHAQEMKAHASRGRLFTPFDFTQHQQSLLTYKFMAVKLIVTVLTLTVLVTTIDVQWEGMGDVGSARYEPVLLPPCPTIKLQ